MQSNSLYAHVDNDVWMSDWSGPSMTADANERFEPFNDQTVNSEHITPSMQDGYPYYQNEVWDTPLAADEPEYQTTSFSYSAAFNKDFVDPDGDIPDFDLVASDGVHFAVTTPKLRSSSSNDFAGLLASFTSSAMIGLPSPALNLVLHGIYGLSPSMYAPTAVDLAIAVQSLESYGLSKSELVADKTPLFQAILMRAPVEPLACYTLAAREELDELAVLISPYTLCLSLPDISDEDAAQMGSLHLRRLFFLHLGRVQALKRILFPPPDLHPPTVECEAKDQRPVSRAWTMAVAEMTWELNPNVSGSTLEACFQAKEDELQCPECKKCLSFRIKRLLIDWSLIKSTI
ncbi:unnamed protein product [Peniophora sp. CBMAI 1063]|nr:unnamed protein product [Peniophora sp. CBMAI 1063]